VKFGNGKSRPNTEGIHPIYGGNGILGYTSETNYEGEIIVIGRVGAYCGATYYENRPVWVSDNALAAIPRENNNAKYLYYFLKNMDLNQHAQGSSHPLVTQTLLNLLDIEISYEEPEQKAIAAVLSSLDDKIDLLHRQNKTLEAMGETLFRQWFVEEANEDWEEGCLGDVIELVYGKGLKKEIRTGTGYPVIGSSGVVGYHSEFLVEGPGIVIGRKGTLGKVIYLWDNFFPIDTTYYIKSKAESAGLLYEYFLLKTLNFEEMNSDSAVPGLNRDIALSTEIEIAPLEKLNRFNQFASTFINKLRENTTQIRTLAKLRDTLLPKLMSGEVRVEYEN
jgi:type I restriction enzyme S subunit